MAVDPSHAGIKSKLIIAWKTHSTARKYEFVLTEYKQTIQLTFKTLIEFYRRRFDVVDGLTDGG